MGRNVGSMRAPFAGLLDAVAIGVFAAVGRASHDESNAVLGVLVTAWPFLTGTAVGWLIALAIGRSAPVTVRAGLVVWIATVVGGMLLRQATDRGTALSFIIVATIVLGVLLVGWRAAASLLARRREAVG